MEVREHLCIRMYIKERDGPKMLPALLAIGWLITPSTQKKQGRTWDPIQKQWVKYSLPEEAARVLKEEEDYLKEQAEGETGGWVWVCRSIPAHTRVYLTN